MARSYRVHACRVVKGAIIAGVPLCASLKAREFTSAMTPERDVSCLVCLYHLGRYMPIAQLREHQMYARVLSDCGLKRHEATEPQAST